MANERRLGGRHWRPASVFQVRLIDGIFACLIVRRRAAAATGITRLMRVSDRSKAATTRSVGSSHNGSLEVNFHFYIRVKWHRSRNFTVQRLPQNCASVGQLGVISLLFLAFSAPTPRLRALTSQPLASRGVSLPIRLPSAQQQTDRPLAEQGLIAHLRVAGQTPL